MKIIKYRLEGDIQDFSIISESLEFEGDIQECEIEMKRIYKECKAFFGVAVWRDGFCCENGSGKAEIAFDICE